MRTVKNKIAKNFILPKEVREADLIIKFLNYDDNSVKKLPEKLKFNLERYQYIHGLRMRYKRKSFVVGCLLDKYKDYYTGVDPERKALHDINEAEYVFGEAILVNRKYQIANLLEACDFNIELAAKKENEKALSLAIEVKAKVLKLIPEPSDAPDYEKLKPHTYNFIISKTDEQILKELAEGGAVNLNDKIGVKSLMGMFKDAEDIDYTEEK